MKKKARKLTLNRDTLLKLDHDLLQVVGGVTAVTDCGTRTCAPPYSTCEWSGYQTCNSCQNTCTTNYC